MILAAAAGCCWLAVGGHENSIKNIWEFKCTCIFIFVCVLVSGGVSGLGFRVLGFRVLGFRFSGLGSRLNPKP